MMSLSIPLLRQRSEHSHSVNQRDNDRLSHRRCKIFHHNSTYLMTCIIIIVIITITTTSTKGVISVAAFHHRHHHQQQPTQFHQLQNIPTHHPSLSLPSRTPGTKAMQQRLLHHQQQCRISSCRRSKTQLYFMGSDSGILGVGGPEVVRRSVFIFLLCGWLCSVVA